MKEIKLMIMAIMAMMSLSSCDEKSSGFKVFIDCSPDILGYVTPTIEVTINGEERVKKTLSPSDFEKTDGYSTHAGTGTKVSLYRYIYFGSYDKSEIEGTVSVSYSLKSNVSFNKDLYIFSNHIYLSHNLVDDIAYANNYEIGNTLEFPDKAGVEAFLKEFCSRPYEMSFSGQNK